MRQYIGRVSRPRPILSFVLPVICTCIVLASVFRVNAVYVYDGRGSTNSFTISQSVWSDSTAEYCRDAPLYNAAQTNLCPDFNSSNDHPDDIHALDKFYNSTSGLQWKHADHWLDLSKSVCCWYGIRCDTAQRVIEIYLDGNGLSGGFPVGFGKLHYLQRLHLPHNRLSTNQQLPRDMLNLRHLRFLDLSQCHLAVKLPAKLAIFPNLTCIDITGNSLYGVFPSDLGTLTQLVRVALFENSVTGVIPQNLGSFKSLRHLDIEGNEFTGGIPADIGEATQLEVLNLRSNHLNGTIPYSICKLTKLRVLDLGDNRLEGHIPGCIKNLSSLELFGGSSNNISGTIPSELCGLRKLQKLYLFDNSLEGSVPMCLQQLSHLTYLGLSRNFLNGSIPAAIGTWWPYMTELHLEWNRFTGKIPLSLKHMTKLSLLALGFNQLEGECPPIFASSSLQVLLLRHNLLHGRMPDLRPLKHSLLVFQIHGNQIAGEIPGWIGELTALRVLFLHGNLFNGSIPQSIGNLSSLSMFSVSNCHLSGPIPDSIGNLVQLEQLFIHHNSISGEIPDSLGSLRKLRILQFQHNNITGQLKHWIRHIRSIDASHNPGLSIALCEPSVAQDFPCIGANDNLVELSFSHNGWSVPLRQVTLLLGLSKIWSLDLSYNNIRSTAVDDLGHIDWLKTADQKLISRQPAFDMLAVVNLAHNKLIHWSFERYHLHLYVPFPGSLSSIDVRGIGSLNVSRLQLAKARSLPYETTGIADVSCPTFYVRGASGDFILGQLDVDQISFHSCVCEHNRILSPRERKCYHCHRLGMTCDAVVTNEETIASDVQVTLFNVKTNVNVSHGWYPIHSSTGRPAFEDVFSGIRPTPAIDPADIAVIRCYVPSLCSDIDDSENNPATTALLSDDSVAYTYQCADRVDHAVLMCSRCNDDSFLFLGTCYECSTALEVGSFMFACTTIIGVFVFFWSRNWRNMSGAVSIALFFVQLSPIVERHHSSKRGGGTVLFQLIRLAANSAYINPSGMQCSYSSGFRRSFPAFWVSAIALPVVFVMCLIAYYVRRWRRPRLSSKVLWNYFCGRCYFFAYLLYFPIARYTLAVFNCQSPIQNNGHSQVQYVDAAPWVSCDSTEYHVMFPVAVIVTIVYVVGFPLYFGLALRKAQHTFTRENEEAVERFGFMFVMYSPLFVSRQQLLDHTMHLHSEEAPHTTRSTSTTVSSSTSGTAVDDSTLNTFTAPLLATPTSTTAVASVTSVATTSVSTTAPNSSAPLLQRWEWEFFINGGRKLVLATVLGLGRFDSTWVPVIILVVLVSSSVAQTRWRPYLFPRDNILDVFFISLASTVYMSEVVLLHTDSGNSRSFVGFFTQALYATGEVTALFVVFAVGVQKFMQPVVHFFYTRIRRESDWNALMEEVDRGASFSADDESEPDDMSDTDLHEVFPPTQEDDTNDEKFMRDIELPAWHIELTRPGPDPASPVADSDAQ
jgi:Leucine-rich repeat (LRR) protein